MASASPSQLETQKSRENDAVSNVRRAFQDYMTALARASRQAGDVSGVDTSSDKDTTDENFAKKGPLEGEAVVIVQCKQSLRSNATLLEGKLRGRVKESEALQCCLRSQPCVNGRKRFFNSDE